MRPFIGPMLLGEAFEAEPGQVELTNTSATQQSREFIVPPGVYSICAVAVGRGGDSRTSDDGQSSGGGGGGGLMYANDIPVVPGQRLLLVVGGTGAWLQSTGEAAAFLIGATNGAAASASGTGGSLNAPGGTGLSSSTALGRVSFSGGSGRRWNGATRGGGGGAASYTGNGGAGSGNSNANGAARSLKGSNGGSLVLCGSGLGGAAGGGINRQGGVRVIWGKGRSYPANALDV